MIRPSFWITCWSVLLLLSCSPDEEHAEVGRDQVDPPECRLAVEPTGVELRSNVRGNVPDPGIRIARDGRGRFISDTGSRGQIAVWSAEGTFLRAIGREGGGPEELGSIRRIFVDGRDRIHVIHGRGEWSVLSPDLEFLSRRSSRNLVGVGGQATVLEDGTVVRNAPRVGEQRHFFLLVESDGETIRSFGDLDEEAREASGTIDRSLTSAGGQRFWAAPWWGSPKGFTLEEWSAEGVLLRTVTPELEWFPDEVSPPEPGKRPPPRIAIHEDGQGFLLVSSVVPNEDWRWLEDPVERSNDALEYEMFDYRYDLVDVESGRVVASGIMDLEHDEDEHAFWGLFPGTRMAYRRRTTDEGLWVMEIVEFGFGPCGR